MRRLISIAALLICFFQIPSHCSVLTPRDDALLTEICRETSDQDDLCVSSLKSAVQKTTAVAKGLAFIVSGILRVASARNKTNEQLDQSLDNESLSTCTESYREFVADDMDEAHFYCDRLAGVVNTGRNIRSVYYYVLDGKTSVGKLRRLPLKSMTVNVSTVLKYIAESAILYLKFLFGKAP